jgi:hypothetical protein
MSTAIAPLDHSDFEPLDEAMQYDDEPTIEDDHRAEDNLRHLAYWRRERQKIASHAKAEIAKITEWEGQRIATIDGRIAWHERGLQGFLYQTGKKTLKLIHGTLKKTKGREKVEVLDPDAFCQGPLKEFISQKVSFSPNKKAILAYIKETGEIPEGTDLVTGEDTYKFETN